jgi:hypothetical protein
MTTKLTKAGRKLFEAVKEFAGTSGHERGFYCECAPDTCKPWNVRTVKALKERGLIRVIDASLRGGYRETDLRGYLDPGSLFYLTLTEKGKKHP